MDKGAFGVHEEHVRDPDLLYEPAIKCHAQIVRAWKRQPLVLPIVPQIEGHGEVLQVGGRAEIYPPTVGTSAVGNAIEASGLSIDCPWRRQRGTQEEA